MPYRRLPNTDAARLRAMRTAKQQNDIKGNMNVPFSSRMITEIQGFIPVFERAIEEYKMALSDQSSRNDKYQTKVKNVRMYISHFIQVLNLSCIRNEIKSEKKLMYKLLPENYSVPDLSTEMLLLEWGKNVIDGEIQRTSVGGIPIYNPTLGKLKVHYDLFKEAYQTKKVYQKKSHRFLEGIQQLRERADEIILRLWNEIEGAYAELETEEMQEHSKEYGIVYYLRRKERMALKHQEETESVEEQPL